VIQTYSTDETAKQIGIHRITLQRWLAGGIVRPSIQIPLKNRTLWRWTKADLKKALKLKGSLKPGPRPKRKKK